MKYVNLHTHTSNNLPNTIEIINQYPHEFRDDFSTYSIGIHPWYIEEGRLASDLKIIKSKLSSNKCIALGECGLDKRIDKIYSAQIDAFEAQLDINRTFLKPVILHCVASFDEVILSKKNSGLSCPFILHGFSKNAQVASQLLNQDFYLSFGKYLLRNPELGKVFAQIPNEKIFLETDTMTESLEEVYTFAAQCRNISLEEMQSIVWENYQRVFGRVD